MKDSPHAGLLLLDKEPGLTSFQALNQVKKLFSTSKVGHTGTLDKFATGLLPVLVGRAVKLAPWFSGADKRYEGLIRFGEETDTLDPEGEVVAGAPPPGREALEAALPAFRGTIVQKPPVYSALHLDGKRAHELARSGVEVEMPGREITIYDLELLSYEPPLARIRVHCSKGTYIRSLARDIARAAGSRAHLAALRRTGVADFRLEEAVSLARLPAGSDAARDDAARAALLPLNEELFARLAFPALKTGEAGKARLVRGQGIAPLFASGELLSLAHLPKANGPKTGGVSPCGGVAGVPPAEGVGRDCSAAPAGGDSGAGPTAGGDFPLPEYAVFGPHDEFIAIIQKKEGRWGYGYVYAGAGESCAHS